jgi:tetratricopeptide (TPR) repeat protein
MTRASLLERYRPPQASPADLARARERTDKGLSRARGAAPGFAAGASAERHGRRDPALSNELRKQQYDRATQRLGRLERKDPARAKQVMRAGESLAVASEISLRLAIGTSFAACGGGNGWTWWDPCNSGYGSPANACWNTYGPYSWWWWNNCSYWMPSWGWGWSWGASWGNWNFGWSSHPNWCYPGYRYWGGSPWWYTSVIYVDDYDPPQQQVVVVHEYEAQPAPEAQPAAEVQRGEAALGDASLPPEKRDPALAQALARSAQQYVALGDLAFSERRYGDAVSHYAKAIEYAPDDAVLYMLLSDALFATGDYHYAASALRKALELEPRLVDTIVDKHAVYSDPQDFEKQLGYLESYLKDNFLDEDARLVLGANYLFGNKPHQALDLLQSSFSLEVRKSRAGTLLFERAQHLAAENPFSK